MSTIEAIGNQFDLKRVNQSLIISLAIILIVADAAVIAAKIVSSFNSPVSAPQIASQSSIFPISSQACLQNCAPANYQPTAAIQPAAQTVFQPAINVINY